MEKRILIIDNDRESVVPLQQELERQGYLVQVIEDGEMGLQQIRTEPPDLAIIGIEQPGMHGVEVLKAIRADETMRELPVIVYANIPDDPTLFRWWQSGPDCTLTKPGSATEISGFINRVFRAQLEGE